MQKTRSTKGFSIIAVLIALAVFGLIVIFGALVFGKRKPANTSANTSEKKVETKYLAIDQWKVKVPINEVPTLSYDITSQNDDSVITLRTDELDALSTNCVTNRPDVARGLANQKVPNDVGNPNFGNTYKTDYDSLVAQLKAVPGANLVAAKVGDYYYVTPDYRSPSCFTDAEEIKKENEELSKIAKAMNAMEAN